MEDFDFLFSNTYRKGVKDSLRKKSLLGKILGRGKAVRQLLQTIEKSAACDVNILITGESGTGKELVARVLHYLSPRAGYPFVAVNCGAIPESLFENELFGHVKGAFTDARYPQNGLVKEAEAGTLFLDEVSMITPYCQVKLLRLLQDREYKALGDPKPRRADIRVLAATNENLEHLIEGKGFREDLFYRLNIVTIDVPPLRTRREDIPLLVDYFLEKYSVIYKKSIATVSSKAMEQLIAYPWPGNIRQLENMMQQCIVLAPGPVLSVGDLQFPAPGASGDSSVLHLDFNEAKKNCIQRFEKKYLERLLREFNGNMPGAAARAGKSRTALWNLLAKYKLHPREFSRRA